MTTLRFPGILGVLILALPALSDAQPVTPSGEELYIDRLGCWNCHGSAGEGGSGPGIAKTQDPLWRFMKYVRLPNGEMPPLSPVLASDVDLLTVYQWLRGVDTVAVPPSVIFALKAGAAGAGTGGQTPAGTEVDVTARAGTGASSPDLKSLRYLITLRGAGWADGESVRGEADYSVGPRPPAAPDTTGGASWWTRAGDPVANRDVQYYGAGRKEPSTMTTDQQGQALLGPEDAFVVADTAGSTGRLRMTLPAGRYALVVEAIDGAESADRVVVGVGTMVFSAK